MENINIYKARKDFKFLTKWIYRLFYIAIMFAMIAILITISFEAVILGKIIGLLGLASSVGIFYMWFKLLKIGATYGKDVLR